MKPHPGARDYSDEERGGIEMKPGDLVRLEVKPGLVRFPLWDKPSDYEPDDPGMVGMFTTGMIGLVLESVRNSHAEDWVRVMESGRIGWILEERLVVLSG